MTSPAQVAIQQQMSLVEDTLKRIVGHRGVVGYIVMNHKDGSIMRAVGFDDNKDIIRRYATKLFQFTQLSHSVVRTLDYDDELTFLRMRWRHREIILAPDYVNKEYTLLVVHDKITEEEDALRKAQRAAAGNNNGGTGGSGQVKVDNHENEEED
eukprot:PhM_4_TR17980/c0_g1_i1/m.80992/K10419/DYNLRB, DNCL2; dynein light chain roadblock-type